MQEPSVGSESFVDVIANLVGILVVLLALVGLGVRREHLRQQSPEHWQRQVASERERVQSLRSAVEVLHSDVEQLRQQLAEVEERANELRARSNSMQRTLGARRGEQAELAQRLIALRQQRQALQAELSRRLQVKVRPAKAAEPTATRVRELRVPISRPVPRDADEIHFELRAGRVAYVPLEPLLAQVHERIREAEQATQPDELTGVVGPVGAFSLRFRAVRHGAALQQRVLTGSLKPRLRLVEWQLVPAARDRGEPVDRALATGSRFWAALSGRSGGRSYVTIWVYEDSFAAFRRVRDALYDRGYFVAARPLFLDDPIAGATHGTPSYAQ